MIRKILALVVILITTNAFAQNDIDAMRYSQTSSYGDARFMAMGGAFGSLGANISCINNNPAGIAMYRKGELVVTPGFQLQSAEANHYGTSSSDFSNRLSLSNIGFVAAWNQQPRNTQTNYQAPNNNDERYGPGYSGGNSQPSQRQPKQSPLPGTNRWAFGMNFNRVADFNYHTTISGYVPAASSITSEMASRANGNSVNNLDQFNEGLFEQMGMITPYTNPNTLNYDSTGTNYAALAAYDAPGTMYQQTKTIQSSGRVGELGLALARSFNDKFYFGGSIGVPFVKYNYQSTLTEFDYKNADSYFSSLSFQENLVTSGVGINAKLGGIYRFNSGVKVGLYGQTPTDYKLTDNYQNTLNVTYDGSNSVNNGSVTSPAGNYSYKFHTPARAGASVSYVFKKLLAFSVDGEYVDYASAKYPDNITFFDVNTTIRQKYSGTANLKAGVELNIRPVVLRAGFGSYGSPFGDVLSGKFVRNSFSGGIGFRGSHNVYLDLGFVYTKWAEKYYVVDPMYIQPSSINYSTLYITATLGIKFN